MKLYIQISPNEIKGVKVKSNHLGPWHVEPPLIAVKLNTKEVVECGRKALRFIDSRDSSIKLYNPFQSYAALGGNLEFAEAFLRWFNQSYLLKKWAILIPPIIIINPIGYIRSLTQIEYILLRDLSIRLGAREAWVTTREGGLSETELRFLNKKNLVEMQNIAAVDCEVTQWPNQSQ